MFAGLYSKVALLAKSQIGNLLSKLHQRSIHTVLHTTGRWNRPPKVFQFGAFPVCITKSVDHKHL